MRVVRVVLIKSEVLYGSKYTLLMITIMHDFNCMHCNDCLKPSFETMTGTYQNSIDGRVIMGSLHFIQPLCFDEPTTR